MPYVDLNSISLTSQELKILKRMNRGFRPDNDTGKHLNRIGLAKWVFCGNSGHWRITTAGVRYLEYIRDQHRERMWNRGLAIVAIIISLVALALEFDSRGYLNWVKPEKTHEAQSTSAKSESQ